MASGLVEHPASARIRQASQAFGTPHWDTTSSAEPLTNFPTSCVFSWSFHAPMFGFSPNCFSKFSSSLSVTAFPRNVSMASGNGPQRGSRDAVKRRNVVLQFSQP